ncbi:thiamine diphosphokinase [bacterium]|nr:thiamine diphosphokinase [bacterium]
MKGLLIASGESWDRALLIEELKRDKFFIICVDGGTNYAYELGIIPNMTIGDMDSVESSLLKYYKELDVPFKEYPRDKDKTDFHLALEELERFGIKEVLIFGIVGTRLDHTLSALGVIRRFVRENRIRLIKISLGIKSDGYIFNRRVKIQGKPGEIISLIPMTDKVEGVTTHNLRYKLDKADIYLEDSLTVSNEIEKSPCSVEIEGGVMLVIHHRS